MPSTKTSQESAAAKPRVPPKKKQQERKKKTVTSAPHADKVIDGAEATVTKRSVPRVKETAKKIRAAQHTKKLVIPKAPLERIVREILASLDPGHRMTPRAFKIIRRCIEAYVMRLSWHVREFAEHAGRNTIQCKDFVLWQKVCSEANIPMPDLKASAVAEDQERADKEGGEAEAEGGRPEDEAM